MRYCKLCVQPDTRPGIFFSDDGICGACLWEKEKAEVNWAEREQELRGIVDRVKGKASGPYDCAIGVSGGKDSTFQAVYARDTLGLRPLLVNCEPDGNTDVGRYNIENLKQQGFDVIGVRPNPRILRQLVKKDFYNCLNPLRVTEYPLWASAYIMALHFTIPLVIQGENPGQTLGVRNDTGMGGDALTILKHNTIKNDPFESYCDDKVSAKDLFLYRLDRERILESGIQAIWLSYYAKEWSQPHNAAFSIRHGLRIRPSEENPYAYGTYRRFSQLDAGPLLEVNQLFKYIKFGFGQATDHACYDIRDGLISRDEATFLVKELDGCCTPESIAFFCRSIDITVDEFWRHANTFRGDMWRCEKNQWALDSPIWEQNPIQGKYTVAGIQNRLGM